jgi:hypothetical protein
MIGTVGFTVPPKPAAPLIDVSPLLFDLRIAVQEAAYVGAASRKTVYIDRYRDVPSFDNSRVVGKNTYTLKVGRRSGAISKVSGMATSPACAIKLLRVVGETSAWKQARRAWGQVVYCA